MKALVKSESQWFTMQKQLNDQIINTHMLLKKVAHQHFIQRVGGAKREHSNKKIKNKRYSMIHHDHHISTYLHLHNISSGTNSVRSLRL